jgi:hypothetical protein
MPTGSVEARPRPGGETRILRVAGRLHNERYGMRQWQLVRRAGDPAWTIG